MQQGNPQHRSATVTANAARTAWRHWPTVACMVALTCGSLAAATPGQGAPLIFSGAVVDDPGQPVAGVTVHLAPVMATTVAATDLIIAACAIAADAELLHVDNHFTQIAAQSALCCRAFTQSAG